VATAGFAAAVMMLEMVFDPRYRSFPSAAHSLPALVYLCRPVNVPRRNRPADLHHRCRHCAAVVREGLQNQQAWGWALVSVLMVAALWRCLRVRKADAQASPSHGQLAPMWKRWDATCPRDYQAPVT
jgi:hypothetical protein